MLRLLAAVYVIGFFVIGAFLTFTTEMNSSETMDIAAEWPIKLYKYVDLYFEMKSAEEYSPARK